MVRSPSVPMDFLTLADSASPPFQVCSFVGLYYNVIIGWSIFYFFQSFRYPLPWAECSIRRNGSLASEWMPELNSGTEERCRGQREWSHRTPLNCLIKPKQLGDHDQCGLPQFVSQTRKDSMNIELNLSPFFNKACISLIRYD